MASPHIKIKRFTGGRNGAELTALYFQEGSNGDKFHLFKGQQQIHTEPDALSSGKDFRFKYNDLDWTVTEFWISEADRKAHGHWASKPPDGEVDPESGTFQAQGGGSVEAELKAKASGALK